MPVPKVYTEFIENSSSYTIQPDIPAWINVDLAQQFDLVTYENDLFLTKQLLGRVYREVFRISGEVIRENFKNTLT